MRVRLAGLLTSAALIAALFAAAPASQAAGCGNNETIALKTFHLVLEADKKVYEVGDVATVNVTVTRPAHEDPVGAGVYYEPPQSFPAEDVNVGMGLRIRDVFLFGYALSDQDGNAAVKIKIEPWTPAGTALADGFAWLVALETPCLRVEENGYRQEPRIFKVVK